RTHSSRWILGETVVVVAGEEAPVECVGAGPRAHACPPRLRRALGGVDDRRDHARRACPASLRGLVLEPRAAGWPRAAPGRRAWLRSTGPGHPRRPRDRLAGPGAAVSPVARGRVRGVRRI